MTIKSVSSKLQPQPKEPKLRNPPKIAEGKPPYTVHQFDILAILEAPNDQEKLKGDRIQEFAAKIAKFFAYVQNCEEGKRLVVKINFNIPEQEIYEKFAEIYTRYKILNRKTVSDYFFKETEDLA